VIGAARVRTAIRGGPLASRSFRLLAAGQLTSTVGDYCYAVALPWLVLTTHGGPVLLGAVLACYGIPRIAAIPVGGALADRLGARAVMLGADTVRCGLVAALAVIAGHRLASLALLGPIAAVLGAGEGLFIPASMAIMPTLLDQERLQAGNALNMAAVELGTLIGPVLGGIIVATAGSAPAFAVDAGSFAVSAVSLALIAPSRRAAGDAATAPAGAADHDEPAAGDPGPQPSAPVMSPGPPVPPREGVLGLLRHARLLQVIVLVCLVANAAFGGTFEVALPALAHARYGAAGYGALLAALGAGAVLGTLAAASGRSFRRPAVMACRIYLIGGVAIGLVPFLGGIAGAAAAILVFGACNGFGNALFLTLLQRWAPAALLGRVMSVVMLAALGIFPVSVAVAGIVVRRLGPVPFFPVAAAALIATILGALTQREFRSFSTSTSPAAPLTEPV
jgi:predicted MFS family arabinose efflux permease